MYGVLNQLNRPFVLYVSEEAVKAVALEDEKIKSVSFDIAKPGESVRITPVKDVIEPTGRFLLFLLP